MSSSRRVAPGDDGLRAQRGGLRGARRPAAAGWGELAEDPADADVAVVNTCGFIESAKTRLGRRGPRGRRSQVVRTDRAVVAVGCLAERYGAELARRCPGADAVVGFDAYPELGRSLDSVLHGTPVPPTRRATGAPCRSIAPVDRAASSAHAPGHAGRWPWRRCCGPARPPAVGAGEIASGRDRRLPSAPSRPSAARSSRVRRTTSSCARWLCRAGARAAPRQRNSTSYPGKDVGQLRALEAPPRPAEVPGIEWVRVSTQPAEMRPGLLDVPRRHPRGSCRTLTSSSTPRRRRFGGCAGSVGRRTSPPAGGVGARPGPQAGSARMSSWASRRDRGGPRRRARRILKRPGRRGRVFRDTRRGRAPRPNRWTATRGRRGRAAAEPSCRACRGASPPSAPRTGWAKMFLWMVGGGRGRGPAGSASSAAAPTRALRSTADRGLARARRGAPQVGSWCAPPSSAPRAWTCSRGRDDALIPPSLPTDLGAVPEPGPLRRRSSPQCVEYRQLPDGPLARLWCPSSAFCCSSGRDLGGLLASPPCPSSSSRRSPTVWTESSPGAGPGHRLRPDLRPDRRQALIGTALVGSLIGEVPWWVTNSSSSARSG